MIRAVSFLLCSTWSSSVLGALAALSSRVVEHSQGAAMLVRRIAKPPARVCCSKVGAVAVLHWFCRALLGAGSPVAATAASPAHLTMCANSHSPCDKHGPMSPTWRPALLCTGLPDALLSPGIS